ncbi:hypothetical protein Vadar_028966 [Vaccinium darrowii]|uniref:Uncharacterized protein n=1 Tax=Vaccinium darrowii TaxID=229202 RepID=A0ACB7XL42_9ERIC|nr:hypothetical protein Vadar_028966 [Vaccinium darrowii]
MVGAAGYDRINEVKEFDNSKMGVKGLSDSGITTIPKFFVHPPETISDLRKSLVTGVGIPVIDLSNVDTEAGRAKAVGEIREAAKTWGFFQLISHCVPVPVLDDTIATIKAFHDLPIEQQPQIRLRVCLARIRFVWHWMCCTCHTWSSSWNPCKCQGNHPKWVLRLLNPTRVVLINTPTVVVGATTIAKNFEKICFG